MEVERMEPERVGSVESAGVKIVYRCFGDASHPPLLLLHGNGEDYTCFSRQLLPFSEEYYLIAPDARGHGESGDGDPFTLDQMALDTLAVLDALQIKRAHILGFSDGANVATLLALARPEIPASLILVGGNLFPEGIEKKELAHMRREEKMLRLLSAFTPEKKKKLRLLGLMTRQPQIDPKSLQTLHMPSLVIAGEADLILESHTKLIAKSLPNSHMRIVPSCGHFPLKDQPQWANSYILAFLKRERGETS